MNEFKTYHPIVNFIYFVFVLVFSCLFMHPVCLAISLICGFAYSALLRGRGAAKRSLALMLPLLLAMALINPVFNHAGVHVLTYLPGGNPLTIESVIYGVCAAAMLISVLCWFSCYNAIMTSDKFIYLFGRVIPSLSLILSMTLRFVPRFTAQLKVVVNAQKCMGRDVSHGSILTRAKHALSVLSVMTTWALENAIETADSMKSRGYGQPGRTAFSIFKFDRRDAVALSCIAVLGIYVLTGYFTGGMYFVYFPFIRSTAADVYSISCFMSYGALCVCPILIEWWEARKWKAIKSKL